MRLYLTHKTRDGNPYSDPKDWIAINYGQVGDYRDAGHDVIEIEVGPRGAIKSEKIHGRLGQR